MKMGKRQLMIGGILWAITLVLVIVLYFLARQNTDFGMGIFWMIIVSVVSFVTGLVFLVIGAIKRLRKNKEE